MYFLLQAETFFGILELLNKNKNVHFTYGKKKYNKI